MMIRAALMHIATVAQEANRSRINVADLFKSLPYTSVGGARTIVNGIDLDTHGGFIWERCRSHADEYHSFMDTERGLTQYILPLSSGAEGSDPSYMQSFNTDGFSLQNTLASGRTLSTHAFRRSPRFFDIVLYTGNGAARSIAHNLGVEPGMIWVKKRNGTTAWRVYHRSLGATNRLELQSTAAQSSSSANWDNTAPTASTFRLGTDTAVNNSGDTYLAYVFAHDPTGVIQCGSYTGNGSSSGPSVTLGWQPQYLLIKRADSTSDWNVIDAARAFSSGNDEIITLNTLGAATSAAVADPNSTGFTINTSSATFNASGGTYIFMAIRAET